MSRLLVPTDLGTLPFWGDFQTAANVTKDASNNVTALTARMGSQVPSVAGVSGKYPVFVAAGLNGFDCAQFTAGGLNSATLATPLAANTPVNWFFVGSLPTGAAGYARSASYVPTAGSSADAYSGLALLSTGSGTAMLRGYNLFNGTLTSATTANAVHVYAAYTLDGTTSNISVDAGAVVNSTSQHPYFGSALAGFNFGWSGGDGPWGGLIGEGFAVLGVMTQAQVDQAIGYLAWRWANQAALPSGFAYKSAAPMVADSGATLAASSGTFAVAGQAATFSFTGTTTLAGAPGALSATGQPATFANQSTGTLAANPGEFSAPIQPATFSSTLIAALAPYSVAGQASAFTATLPATSGNYAVSNQTVAFMQSSMLVASPGALTIAGQLAAFNTQTQGTLAASLGSFIASVGAAGFGGNIAAQLASFSLTGAIATFGQTAMLVSSQGIFTISPHSASFSFAGISYISAEKGVLSVSGGQAFLKKIGIPLGVYVRYDPYDKVSYTPYIVYNDDYESYSPLNGEQI